MFKYDPMSIVMSSKEKNKETRDILEAFGCDVISKNIITADYQRYGLAGGLRTEKKADLSETLKSFAGNVRYNTENECWRAHADGTPLIYVIGETRTESGAEINDIDDIFTIKRSDIRPENRHESINNAIDKMYEMKEMYGVKYMFVDPDRIAITIYKLLRDQPGTIHEGDPALQEGALTDDELEVLLADYKERMEREKEAKRQWDYHAYMKT